MIGERPLRKVVRIVRKDKTPSGDNSAGPMASTFMRARGAELEFRPALRRRLEPSHSGPLTYNPRIFRSTAERSTRRVLLGHSLMFVLALSACVAPAAAPSPPPAEPPSSAAATPSVDAHTPVPTRAAAPLVRRALADLPPTGLELPPVPTLPRRSINGDWIVRGVEVVEKVRIVLNGNLKVGSGGSLTLKGVVLELGGPPAGLDPFDRNASVRIEPEGRLELSDSFVIRPGHGRALVSADKARSVSIRRTSFEGVAVACVNCPEFRVEDSAFLLEADLQFDQAISALASTGPRIVGNRIVGRASDRSNPPNGAIWLFQSRGGQVSDNVIVGTKNGISLRESSDNRVSGNAWTGPTGRRGEAGIGLERWSNNNVIEGNTLQNAGSAILVIFQSTNNKISRNTIRNAGMGIVLRWASRTMIDANDLRFFLEDAFRFYRSYDNVVLNNRVTSAEGGISLFSSWNNLVGGNTIAGAERAVYLFDAKQNTIRSNDITDGFLGVLSVESSNNVMTENNLTSFVRAAYDEGKDNTWLGNYWGSANQTRVAVPPDREDARPAGGPLKIAPLSVPEFRPLAFEPVRSDRLRITGQTVWENESKTIPGNIEVERDARLVLRNTILTFEPRGLQADTWVHVKPGGTLEIYGSKLFGPQQDHSLTLKVYPGSRFVMKDSEFHNGGSWVGTFGAAVALEGEGAIVENSAFHNVHTAISSERASGLRIARNTITNAVKAIAIIGTTPRTTVEGNRIRKSAVWGILVWSIEQGISSSIRDNTVTDGWGVGIYDAFEGSFALESGNASDLRGIGAFVLRRGSQVDARQARPLSLTRSAVQAGEDVEVALNVAHVVFAENPRKTFVANLGVNEKMIDERRVTLEFGQAARLILRGKAPEAGTVSVVVK